MYLHLLQWDVWGGSECDIVSGANLYIVFYNNYGSFLLSFRDMTTGRTTERRTDVEKHRMPIWP